MPALAPWTAVLLIVSGVVAARVHFSGPDGPDAPRDDPQAQVAAAMLAALETPPQEQSSELPSGASAEALVARAPALEPAVPVLEAHGLTLARSPFLPRPVEQGDGFARLAPDEAGFAPLPLPPLYTAMQPGVNEFAPLAAADVHGDGWPDVAVGTAHGVFLYANTGGRFVLQEVDFPAMRTWTITALALVDLDGSGSADLLFCGWMQGCHVLLNQDGEFTAAAHRELPRGQEPAVHALGVADIDRDGVLDVVAGPSSALGWNFAAPHNVRVWYGRGDGTFREQVLSGPGGETLSLLLSDLDGDGWTDLYVGNDHDEPDLFYRNERGLLVLSEGADNPFPAVTESTMSVDSGDVDNDGRPELYAAAIAYGGGDPAELGHPTVPPHEACQSSYADREELGRCLTLSEFQTAVVRSRDITDVRECRHFPDAVRQRQCIAAGYLWNEAFATLPGLGATRNAVVGQCERIPTDLTLLRDVCAGVPDAELDYAQAPTLYPDQPDQRVETNLLLAPAGDRFEDVTEHWGVRFGGWSWNARFADLDNDTWQDLFVAQGTRLRFSATSNLLYRNDGGRGFTELARAVGLADHVPTGGSLFVDYDLDGRLDLITHPFALTPVVWRNDLAEPRAFELRLVDTTSGNRDAVGARVEIRNPEGLLQVREIKTSGGFGADDPKEARFGLGDWSGVGSVTVTWPDGHRDTIEGLDLGPGRYTLERTTPSR